MSASRVTTRFAPSPTGGLHLGNARTALFSHLFARGAGGRFVLRIEDTDSARSEAAYADALQRELRWLGLEWDGEPVHQSERGAVYEEHLARLPSPPRFVTRADRGRGFAELARVLLAALGVDPGPAPG